MKKIYFTVIFLLVAFVLIDYHRALYGKGFNLLHRTITYGYNTDFDSYEGFKIEEDNFIQIIGKGTKIDNAGEVAYIISYAYDDEGIYCKIKNTRNRILFVKTILDNNRSKGRQLFHSIIQKSAINLYLDWYIVDNPDSNFRI